MLLCGGWMLLLDWRVGGGTIGFEVGDSFEEGFGEGDDVFLEETRDDSSLSALLQGSRHSEKYTPLLFSFIIPEE